MTRRVSRVAALGALAVLVAVSSCGTGSEEPAALLEAAGFGTPRFESSAPAGNVDGDEGDGTRLGLDWWRLLSENGSTATDESVDDGSSLRIRYPAGDPGGAQAAWLIPADDEYYLAYSVLFAPDFDFNGDGDSGGKLPGLAAGGLCSGGQTCDGTNGFTARYMWRKDGRAQLYLYDMDRDTSFGREVFFADADGDAVFFEPGTWHRLVQRVRTNSPDSSDGLVQVWMDGEQVVDVGGLRFRTNDDLVDTVYFSTFFGGDSPAWYPDRDSYAYFDDFVVSVDAADVGL